MAKKRRKKLTKAEAGRLGGRATVRKYGTEHMRAIGKAGFAALRRKFGFMGGSGRGALRWLTRQGKLPGETPEQQRQAQQDYEQLLEQLLPKDEPEEGDPVIAQILASIRSAPTTEWGGL
jgi:hypothetical protein